MFPPDIQVVRYLDDISVPTISRMTDRPTGSPSAGGRRLRISVKMINYAAKVYAKLRILSTRYETYDVHPSLKYHHRHTTNK